MSDNFSDKKTQDFTTLLAVLNLEQLNRDTFAGHCMPTAWGRVYGGQVLAQALFAAQKTLDNDFKIHSQHAYFLRPGQPQHDIEFKVERVKDGRSFCTRRVTASQLGKPILISSLSFQKPESGLNHQVPFQPLADHQGLQHEHERLLAFGDKIGADMSKRTFEIEYRPTEPFDHASPTPQPHRTGIWMRACGSVGDNTLLNTCLLTYMSDSYLLDTSLLPHGLSYMNRRLQAASLDHALWFYGDFQADQWHYYELECPKTGNARGINFGKIYTESGELIAAAAQECLMRIND